jgi:putative hydrolase of the HAD superfamily
MDDTLLDTSGGVEESWKLTCQVFAPELGCESDALHQAIRSQMAQFWKDEAAVEHWRTRLHDARRHNIEVALTAQGWDHARAHLIADRYWEEQSSRFKLFEDALATLDRVRAAGLKTGLITNGPADMQRDKIARFDLARHFDVVVIEGEFGRGKPHAEVFRHAVSVCGAQPETSWHVGDNLYADIGGAQSAGLHAAWIHRDRLELKEGEAIVPDRVLAHLTELLSALDL